MQSRCVSRILAEKATYSEIFRSTAFGKCTTSLGDTFSGTYESLTVRRVGQLNTTPEYGLKVYGRGDRRIANRPRAGQKFLDGFHYLMYCLANNFYIEDANAAVVSNGFPVLAALKDLHLTLAFGDGNQMRSLTFKARAEMMIMQYMLATPEVCNFLQTRFAVAPLEGWQGPLDTMRSLQGWGPESSSSYRDLAVYGEKITLLSSTWLLAASQ